MAIYSITSGSGFSGNAQYCSGSYKEGLMLNNIISGSKYAISFQYRSNVPLEIYSGYFGQSVGNMTIPLNTGSAKNWSGEFLSIHNKENYIGIASTGSGWFEIDQLRVRNIPNLFQTGSIESGGDWANIYNGTTKANGKLNFNYTGGAVNTVLASSITLLPAYGKKYRLSFTVTDYITGSFYITFQNLFAASITGNISANGTYTFDGVPTSTGYDGRLFIYTAVGNIIASIDNIHVYEIPDWTASGNHYISTNITDKYLGTSSLLISASGAGREEKITNGGFDSDTSWSKSGTANISGGTANLLASGDYVTQQLTLTVGKVYDILYTVTVTPGASVQLTDNANGQYITSTHTTSGTYGQRFTCAFSSCRPRFTFNTGTGTVNIDNVSFKEVVGEASLAYTNFETLVAGNKYTLEGWAKVDFISLAYGSDKASGWNFTSGWSTTGDAVIDDSNSFHSTTGGGVTKGGYVAQNKSYKLIIDVTLSGGNYLQVRDGTSNSFPGSYQIGSSGLYIMYFTNIKTATSIYFFLSSGTVGFNRFELYEADLMSITTQIGTKSVTINPTISGTSAPVWTKFILNFEAGTSELNQDLKLYLNSASNVFIDNISITQAYDYHISTNTKMMTAGAILGSNSVFSPYLGLFASVSNLRAEIGTNSTSYIDNTTTFPVVDNNWHLLKYTINRVENVTAQVDLSSRSISITSLGKHIFTQNFQIGKNWVGYLSGSAGATQIIRFTNISSSNFNPLTYRMGWPISGGGSEVVLWFDPSRDGTTISSSLYDWSGLNNHLTGSSLDLTNRILVT